MRNNLEKERLSEKISELCIWYQIEDSHRWLDLICNRIKICDIMIEHLVDTKPYFFQKKKLEKFNNELKDLEIKKEKLYEEINDEILIIEKLNKSINK